jgi:PTS system ascorbate-specific IIA component
MINSVTEHGPYIVIAPMVALPHARPEAGANKMAFSVLKLNEPVYFTEDKDENYKASLLITLSCVDSDSHLQMLQALVGVLSDEVKNKAIFDASSVDDILSIFSI